MSYNDIIVINPNPITTVKAAGMPRQLLFTKGIASHVAGVDTNSDIFFKADEDSVAFTGIFRAKGNEAGMVYIMNAQDCLGGFGVLLTPRNQLFTAITRSKAWVRVLGWGPQMTKLRGEFDRVRAESYTLAFRYPDERTRQSLKVINRDLSAAEQKLIKTRATVIGDLVGELKAGRVMLDDLPPGDLEELRRLLNG